MGAYAGPYIPGVDVAVSSGGGGAVGAPRLNGRLQCRPVDRLEAVRRTNERHEGQHAQEAGTSSRRVPFRRVAAAKAIP